MKKKKVWFNCLKAFLKIFIRKPKFVYLQDKPDKSSIILGNHVGAKAPLSYELYFDCSFRIWGTHEMNDGLKSVYKYLSEVYFYQKKHINKFFSKLISIIAAPLANLFYKGLQLIPTYRDYRLRKSIKESVEVLKEGQNVIIFPEDSSDGYHDNLKSFFSGYMLLARQCYKNGLDVKIYLSYFVKEKRTFVMDKPIRYSEILKMNKSDKEISKMFCDRTNQLRNCIK